MNLQQLRQTNVEGLKALLQTIDTGHFIFISSASVYPPGTNHKENEHIDVNKLSDYGRSKYEAELFLCSRGQNTTILRPRAIYGIGDRVLLPRIFSLRKGPFYLIPGRLDFEISLTCIDNLLLATRCLMNSDTNGSNIYNIADTVTYQLNEIIEQILLLGGRENLVKLKIPPSLLISAARLVGNNNVNNTTFRFFLCNHTISNEKFCDKFNFEMKYSFIDYLPRLVKWISDIGWKNINSHSAKLPWITNE
jgi:nucleoside-diphosphate-sugar epimerase